MTLFSVFFICYRFVPKHFSDIVHIQNHCKTIHVLYKELMIPVLYLHYQQRRGLKIGTVRYSFSFLK